MHGQRWSVPSETTANQTAASRPIGDPAARLKEIRARVTELQRRIQTERDPKAVAELRAGASKLTALLSELVQAGAVAKAATGTPIVWPSDLNVATPDHGEWGSDPTEVARG